MIHGRLWDDSMISILFSLERECPPKKKNSTTSPSPRPAQLLAHGIHRGEGFVDEPNREDGGPQGLGGEDHLAHSALCAVLDGDPDGWDGWDDGRDPLGLGATGKKMSRQTENDAVEASWMKAVV